MTRLRLDKKVLDLDEKETAKITACLRWLTAERVRRVFDDIDTKRSKTRYLHLKP